MEDPDNSVQEMKKQLFNSLKCTGRLDSLKSQLRARLLDHLRDEDGTLLEFKGNRKPSITERILGSLFIDYLSAFGYSFTQSVFLPESQAVSWPAFTFEEMLQLLHLDSTASSHRCLKIAAREKGCLAQQIVMVLQQMPFHIGTQDSSTQTRSHGSLDLDSCLRDIDDNCWRKKTVETKLTFRTLEERLNTFRQEFETRVNAEVALQVSRIRDFETKAVRTEEEGKYRRQLARDCEELEQIHKSRLERIREREESLMEHLVMKEKVIEASAYEQRQKMLASITDLRDREEKVKKTEEQQKRLNDSLEEKHRIFCLKEEEIVQREATCRVQADENAQMKIKDIEEQYRSCQEQLKSDRALLEVEWATYKEDKLRLENELAASKIDKEIVHSLHERLALEETERVELVNSLLEQLASAEEQRKTLMNKFEDFEQHYTQKVEPPTKSSVLDLRHNPHINSNDISNGNWGEQNQGKCCNVCQQQQRRWAKDQVKLQERIKHLKNAVQEALAKKEQASQARRSIQWQLKSSESELLETVTLLKKTQHALEIERLHHYSLRSQIASFFPVSSQDNPHKLQPVNSEHSEGRLTNKAILTGSCGLAPTQKKLGPSQYVREPQEDLHHSWAENCQLPPAMDMLSYTYQTGPKRIRGQGDRPSVGRNNKVNSAPCQHGEASVSSADNESQTNSGHDREKKALVDAVQSSVPVQQEDLDVIVAARDEASHFHQCRNDLGFDSDLFLACPSGNDKEQMPERQKSEITGRACQDQPSKSGKIVSGTDCSTCTENSQGLGHTSSKASIHGIRETKQTAYGDAVPQMSQSSMNYYMMGSSSMKSNGSVVEIKMNGKTVKHSSYTGVQGQERVQTNIGIFEMKVQKKVHIRRSAGSKANPSDEEDIESPTHPEHRETSDKETEGNRSRFSERMSSGDSSEDSQYPCPSGDFDVDSSVDTKKHMPPQTHELQEAGALIFQLQTKKSPRSYEAQQKTRHISQNKDLDDSGSEPCTVDHRGSLASLCVDDHQAMREAKELATNQEMPITDSNFDLSQGRFGKQNNTNELLNPVIPVEGARRSYWQRATEDNFMDMDRHQRVDSSGYVDQQKIHAALCASKTSSTGEVSGETSRQPPYCGESQSPNHMSQGPGNELQTQNNRRGSSSSSHVSLSQMPICIDKIDIQRRDYSEESCSNSIQRSGTIRSTREVSLPPELAPEATSYWKSLQQGQVQNVDQTSGGDSRVWSEQGSYSPDEEQDDWIDDFASGASADYLDNSDAFSLPESDLRDNQSNERTL